jgi:hypothetical protein
MASNTYNIAVTGAVILRAVILRETDDQQQI